MSVSPTIPSPEAKAAREEYRRDHGVVAGDYNPAIATYGLTVWPSELEAIERMAESNGTTVHRIMRLLFKQYLELVRSGARDSDYWEEFLNKACFLIPESYDDDSSPEQIILNYLKDMDTLAGVIARLTSSHS